MKRVKIVHKHGVPNAFIAKGMAAQAAVNKIINDETDYLNAIVEQANFEIDNGMKTMKQLAGTAVSEPQRAMEGSKDAFLQAARIKVALNIIGAIDLRTKKNMPANQILEEVGRMILIEVIRAARFPEHSTSPIHNYASQCHTSVMAEWIFRFIPELD